MMDRRNFIKLASAGSGAAYLGLNPLTNSLFSPQNSKPLIIDAMGELRDVYGPDLIKKMLASGLNSITITLCDPKTFENEAYKAALDGIKLYDTYLNKHPDLFIKAKKTSDIDKARKEGKLAVFYYFQTTTQFGKDLDRVNFFYDMGVRSSQMTYNYQNWAGSGCKERTGAGLTYFGLDIVEKMNNIGMLIDVSHANPATMRDTIKASKYPVINSHTCCMSVFENIRNTSDDNLKLIADRGGVTGICQMRPFLTNIRKGAFEHYLNHIIYAIDISGIDHVCIGSDRDHRVVEMTDEYIAELKAEEGDNFHAEDWPLFMDELNGPGRMEVIWDGLKKRKLPESSIEKIMGLNVYRLYNDVIG